jgi:hypothetical protein
VLALVLVLLNTGVWRIVLTGRLPSQPEDEQDERLSRAFLGIIPVVLGVFLALSSLGFPVRLIAGTLSIGGAILIASAFLPQIRRRPPTRRA